MASRLCTEPIGWPARATSWTDLLTQPVAPRATAREALRRSAVVYLRAHANPLVMSFDDDTLGQSDLHSGSGADDPENDIYYVSNIPKLIDHVLFALVMGCRSAGDGQWDADSLPQAILDKGAESAMGFTGQITTTHGWVFAHEFFDVTRYQVTVDYAADVAAELVWDTYEEYGGTDSWERRGSNVDLRPARFAD